MRLWSLHPEQLDAKGLVAVWREGLLARAVLLGLTKGYRSHPQLLRFKEHASPVKVLDQYLSIIVNAATARGYQFDASKINFSLRVTAELVVTTGQIEYEWQHLLKKLEVRDNVRWTQMKSALPAVHPIFIVESGPIAPWEITS